VPRCSWRAAPRQAPIRWSAREGACATPLIDGHNDLPWIIRARFNSSLAAFDLASDTSRLKPPADQAAMMTDLPRLHAGLVGAQFWSVYVPVEMQGPLAVQATLEQIDIVRQMVARYPHDLEMAYSAGDIRRIHKTGRIGSLIGVEGGHQIADSLAVLRQYYELGARY
jgi:membrane dipeptidase